MRQVGFLLGLALLAGCSSFPDFPIPGEGKHPPKYQPNNNVMRFGDWYSEPESCKLTGNSPEVKPVTDAIPDGNVMELRFTFAVPLAAHPRASFTTYPVGLHMEGGGQTFTVQIPYTPTAVARYLQSDTFLTIGFQPAHSDDVLEVNFGMAGLVSGATYIGRTCK